MNEVIQVDVAALTFLAGTVIPLLTALITKWKAASKVKAIVTLVLSLIGGAVTYGVAHAGAFDLAGLTTALVTTYLAAGVTYQNLWKPTGVAEVVAEVAPTSGIGTEVFKPEKISTEELLELDIAIQQQAAELAGTLPGMAAAPVTATGESFTTIQGQPVYRDGRGYLFTS